MNKKSLYLITASTDKDKTRGLVELTDEEYKLISSAFDDLNENSICNSMPIVIIKWIGYDSVKPITREDNVNLIDTIMLNGEEYMLLEV